MIPLHAFFLSRWVRTAARLVALVGCLTASLVAAVNHSAPHPFASLVRMASAGSNDETQARFYGLAGVAVDRTGHLYLADQGNGTIRKITPEHVVSTFAGLAGVRGSADGPPSEARFNAPTGIVLDASGNLYVSDISGHTIRKIARTGVVTTLAGEAGSNGMADGMRNSARFNQPTDLAIDGAGNIFVNDTGNVAIRRVTPQGVVTTIARSPSLDPRWSAVSGGYQYDRDEHFEIAFKIASLAVDAAGDLLILEGGTLVDPAHRSLGPFSYSAVRKMTPAGALTTLHQLPADVSASHLALDQKGRVVVGGFATIERVLADWTMERLAGSGSVIPQQDFFADGPALTARLHQSRGLAIDVSGNIFFTDHNNVVRKISGAGVVSTVAGYPQPSVERAGAVKLRPGMEDRFER
jgi:hypothetical protein